MAASSSGGPLVSEIHYHPPHPEPGREPVEFEFLEIHNPDPFEVDLGGYRLDKGVAFTFPAGHVVPAGGFALVVADRDAFLTAHPSVDPALVAGEWVGRLSNDGETVRLVDATGFEIDEVRYADAGDWALRVRGPLDFGHRGWKWEAAHDGGGSSLELANVALPNDEGQNWGASLVEGGTPGAANSVASGDLPPLVLEVEHDPAIPRPGEPVTVRCRVVDEAGGVVATVHHRVDGAATFSAVPMTGDGAGGFTAVLPGRSDGTVVEYFVEATDAGALSRTWPAAARLTDGTFAQRANALYQVDATHDPLVARGPDDQPIFRVVMTDAERAELADIGSTPSEGESNAEMNATFISHDAEGIRVRLLASIRNRGASSRTPPPNNHLVKFRSDDHWDGRESIKFNARNPFSQVLGSWLFRRFGIATAEAVPVQLRINGANLASSGTPMYGSYAMVESLDGDFTANHWPGDPDGNLYQVRDDEDTGEEGALQWEGTDPDEYRNTYFKQTNSSEDDFSDLIALVDALNRTPAGALFDRVSAEADLDQWARMLAADSILGNREGGLVTGKGDDYALYRGASDPRFLLVPHDLDSLGAAGTQEAPNASIRTYGNVEGLSGLFDDAQFLVLFYSHLLDLLENAYTSAIVDPIIDDALGSWVAASRIADAKAFVGARTAGILAQIPRSFSADHDLPVTAEGYGRTTDGSVTFSGDFDASRTLSLFVNDRPAALDHRDGSWALDIAAGDSFLHPGLNRVVIRAFDGLDGSGALVHAAHLDLWNDTGSMTPVSGTLTGTTPAGSPTLTVRPEYLPGIPFLVRVELENEDGSLNRDAWDATAVLSASRPDITLTPNTVDLRNGRGSALVSVTGGAAGGEATTLLPRGSTWRFLDDGSDQGTAWRAPGFDDDSWESGPAVLGYGDNQDTVVGFVDANPQQPGTQKNATTYFRTTFDVADPASIAGLTFGLRYDDGAIVYLNGTEVAVTPNMTSGMAFDEYSNGDTTSETTYFPFTVDAAHLVAGTNTVAVEIHQGDGGSSDISLDLEIVGTPVSNDPGDFTLRVDVAGRRVSSPIASLGDAVPATVSGTLAGTETTWSGVVRVTGDVTVPAGHVLTIAPGALVLVDGDATPGSTAGRDIIVAGAVHSEGTAAAPVTITASAAGDSWGQFRFDGADPSWFRFTHVHKAGHAPGGGHTGRGRCFHIRGSSVVFEDSTLTDNFGKLGECDRAGGTNASLTIRRCHLARSVMGFETFDTAVLVEDTHITDMLGAYREDGITDDDDAIYLHAAAGEPMVLRRVVVAHTDDDGIDTLGAEGVVLEDVISRDCFDKGSSILGGSVTIRRAIFTGNDIGLSIKDDGDAVLDHVTVVGNASIGLQVENKTGSDAPSFLTVTNSIVRSPDPVRTDYAETDITFNHCLLGEAWAFAGSADNALDDPLFVDAAARDFHLRTGSPAIDAGDPAAPTDPDGSRADIGRFPYDPAFDTTSGGSGEVVWTPEGGPYHVTDDVTIPEGVKLVIRPGTAVFLDEGKRITVAGTIEAVGTETHRIQVNAVPGAPFVGDPAGNGSLPDGPPKSDGIKLVDSMSPDNVIAWLDIGNAQDGNGSIGIIRSQCLIDHVTFRSTHIRMLYTEDSSVIAQYCTFPDMFAPGEDPDELGLDNISEHIKGVGSPPDGGHYIVRWNTFGTNKGHNDVVDVESARVPDPIAQIIGNVFSGSGDELLDLGGDVYVAENLFRNVFKDDATSDRGYANAISTGDSGLGTTIAVARNVFWDVDHAINLKRDTSTIFENNTIYRIHPDFDDRFGNPSVSSVINLYIPTDTDPNATRGDGAYASGNILLDLTRVFSGADQPDPRFTPLEFSHNLIDPSMPDLSVGPAHDPQTVLDLGPGNVLADPGFLAPDEGDFRLVEGSPAAGAGPLGQDLGAMTPAGIWIAGEPPALTTSTSALLTVGAPGIFGFRWRLDEGPWSDDLDIGAGFEPPAATIRTATIELAGLGDGDHTVEVIGRNFAGDWQETPTVSRTWTVASALPATVRLNEILATGAPDFVEFHNPGTAPFDLGGRFLTDNPASPTKHRFAAGTLVPAGGFLVVESSALGFAFENSGEGAWLVDSDGITVLDSVEFGHQASGFSIGRRGHEASWGLTRPTPGTANEAAATGPADAVRLSEWFAHGDVTLEDDFVELFNPLALPVALGGLFLTDNIAGQPRLFPFPPLTFIGPDSVAAFVSGRDLPFALSSTSEALALIGPSGEIIDATVFGSQPADHSQRRAAGGGTGVEFFRLPTPGQAIPAAGSAEEAAFARALALFDHLRITEIMYDPLEGTEFEFVELRNTGPLALELEGLRFVEGIDFTFPAWTLAPGAEVLIVRNRAAFESRYGLGLPVAGEYSGKLDNGGERVALQLPAPFDAAILRFRYRDEWFPETDGGGRSLEIVDPGLAPLAWGELAAWQASAVDGGTPAGRVVAATGFPAWLASFGLTGIERDTDQDGLAHLAEYALQLDPLVPRPYAPGTMAEPDGRMHLAFLLPTPARGDIRMTLETSTSPSSADSWLEAATRAGDAAWVLAPGTLLDETPAGAGRVLATFEVPPAPGDPPRRFFRLRFDLLAE